DAGSRDGGDDGRDTVQGGEGEVRRCGEVRGGVLRFHPVVVQGRRGQAAQGLRVGEDEAGVQGRGRAIGRGEPVLELRVGRVVRGSRDGGVRGCDAGSRDGGDDGRDTVQGGEGEVRRCGEVRGGVLRFRPVVVQGRRGQAAQGLRVGEDEARVEGRGRPIARGQPVLDLRIGRLVRGPRDGGTRGSDAGGGHGGDDRRDVVQRQERRIP